MKIWQRIFLASMLVTIIFMNLIGIVLIRSQYQQNLEYIRQETEQRLQTLEDKLKSEIKSNMAAMQETEIGTVFYENATFAADDLSIVNAIQTIMQQENRVGVCVYLEGSVYENSIPVSQMICQHAASVSKKTANHLANEHALEYDCENPESEIERPQFIVRDDRLLFCISASGQVYGRDLVIVVQNDATAAKESYWKQMNQLLFYGCLFSVLGAIVLMSLVYAFLYPLKTVRQSVHYIAGGNYETRLPVQGHTELAELSADINEMAGKIQRNIQQLEETAENRKTFIGNMVHEMKTPLTSILGFGDILSIKPELTEDERREYSEIIVKEATRLRNLSGKLMELVQIQNGMIEFRLINLKTLLEESISAQEVLMKEKNISITGELDNALIYGDYDLLQSLIFNIFDNSRKASEQGGTIIITLEREMDEVILSIRDFGRGMDERETEKVKEPFYMVDKSRSRQAGGAGLGLALCAEIMKLHHGVFHIKSEPGEGCLVILKFEKGKEHESEA